jgi:serine/threonine protein kinase/WD40 repeat protein
MSHDAIDELLASCLEQPREQWPERLHALCAGHPDQGTELRRRFEQLVRLGIIEAPPSEVSVPAPDRLGPYRLLERLGSGTMGIVWLALDERLGRRVAVKILRREHVYFESARRRFRREMEAAARLDHPGLCPVYEAGEIDGVPFLAMRYVEGRSLADWLADQRRARAQSGSSSSVERARVELVCAWIAQVAQALHEAHEAGFVHRDVKPANVIIDKDGHLVLLDFGLAHALSADEGGELTLSGAVLGTPAYMAPEQVRGERVDRRTDVWALGVLLYECITLRSPFESSTREALFREILDTDPPSASRVDRGVPEELALVIATALAKAPPDRYATARALAEDLLHVRSYESIGARRPPMWLRGRRWTQRHPVATATIATVSGALLVTLWLLAERTRAQRRLRALAWLGEARSVSGEDADLAFKLAREAWRLDPADPEVVSGVQAAMFDLRAYRVVRDIGSEPDAAGRFLEWVEFSPEGDWFVVTGTNQRPTVHRSEDGAILENGTLDARTGMQVAPIEWSKGGLLACGSTVEPGAAEVEQGRGRVQIYEVADGRVREVGPPRICAARPFSVGFGAHGEIVASLHDKSTIVWGRDGAVLARIPTDSAREQWAAALLPDGRLVAAGAIWTPDGKTRLAELDKHSEPVMWVRIVGHQDRIVTAALNGEVRLWTLSGSEAAPPIERQIPSTTQGLSDIDISPDGKLVVLGYRDGLVRVCRTADGDLIAGWRTAVQQRVTTRFSRDGRRVIGGGWRGAVDVWELDNTPVRTYAGHGGGIFSLAVDPRSEPGRDRFVTASWDGTARLWSDQGVRGVARIDGLHRPTVAAVPGSQDVVIATHDGRVLCCDGEGRVQRQQSLPAPDALGHVCIAPDGHTAIVASIDAGIWLWDVRGAAAPQWLAIEGNVPWPRTRDARTMMALGLGDGSYVVCRNVERSGVFQWQPGTTAPHALALDQPVWLDPFRLAAAVSPDGRMVLVGYRSGALQLLGLDGHAIHPVSRSPEGNRDPLVSVALFADGRRAAAGFESGRVEIRDLATGTVLHALANHDAQVRKLALSPDQRLLASASGDGTAVVCDTASGVRRFVFGDRRGAIYDVTFTSNDRLVTAGDGGRVLWWWLDQDRLEAAVERIAIDPLTERERARFGHIAGR